MSWIPADNESPSDEPRIARDIWQRDGDDEEFDLLPGQDAEDLRNISDPGHDLYDERAILEQQPVAAFVGELSMEGDEVLLITDVGDTFLLDGDVDYPAGEGRGHFVAIGRAGLEEDELGRRRLLVEQVIPVQS